MINLYEKKENCCGCTACYHICPKHSITMEADSEGFLYPNIEDRTCVECRACLKVCPFHKETHEEKIPKGQEIFALKHKDKEVQKSSSSGGAFTAISDFILERGGVICGAAFDENFEVVHKIGRNQTQRDGMKGSKYVQSRLGELFSEVRTELISGKKVLFTGTSCQCAGLKNYLGNQSYPNLILCDIACHGVPSPRLWKDYKKYLEERYHSRITDISFRNKDAGWHNSALKVRFDKETYYRNMAEDPYYILFFSHLSIRPSCHTCVYASYHRVTDITLADFWGIENSQKDFTDDLGVSLVFCNTDKGKALIEAIQDRVSLQESTHRASYQPIFEAPSKVSPMRTKFWEEYDREGSRYVIEKYGKLSKTQKIVKKVIVPVLKKAKIYNTVSKLVFGKGRG